MKKITDLIKKMNDTQKIISISVIAFLVLAITIVLTALINAVTGTDDLDLQVAKTEIVKESINEMEEVIPEEVVELQTAEETAPEQLEEEKVATSTVTTGKTAYYIKVNYGANTVTIYGKDGDGNYTVPVKAMICSCGISTPKGGVYRTSKGYTWGTLIGGVYGQYSTRIVGNILFHSVPYTSTSPDSLEYWEFDKLGTKASAGCVRLMVADAKWIFYNCEPGTMVEFYSDADPGPLGKPSAPIISGNEACRNWDPTDNVPGNPWFNQPEQAPQEEQKEETTQDAEKKLVDKTIGTGKD